MNLKRALVALSAAGMILSGTTQAAPTYSVTNLGIMEGSYSSVAADINNSGQVVGWLNPLNDTGSRAFLYTGGAMTDLGIPFRGTITSASAISDRGQAVGDVSNFFTGYKPHAVVYGNGDITDLGTLGGTSSSSTGINDRGQVVGWAYTGENTPTNRNPTHAFLYSDGRMTDLGTLSGNNSSARDINDHGQVVGEFWTVLDRADPGSQRRAFLYSDSGMTDLGTLGGSDSVANGINAIGNVVGGSYTVGNAAYHAYLYSDGAMIDLDTLGTTFSSASDINDNGQVVGYALNSDRRSFAFLYSAGVMTDLNSLIDPLAGWTITNAVAINDSGQIAANGCDIIGNCRALLLSPVPEAEIYLMMFAGLGLLGMKMRRRNRV